MGDFYTLPEITFVAGETQLLQIRLWTPKPGSLPYNANGASVNFSVINSNNKFGDTVLSKPGSVQLDENGIPSIVTVKLLPAETAALYGKYVYQLTIKEQGGDVEIPNQGHMFIVRNINRGFIGV